MLSIINNFLEIIKTLLNKITAKDVLYFLIICCLTLFLLNTKSNKEMLKERYENNIEVYNDSINYYKSKLGDVVAEKKVFESNIKELKNLNESLYNEIKDLKSKNDILSGMHFNGSIENQLKDTVFIVETDTLYKGFNHKFNFNDEWRDLEGYVQYIPDSLKLNITKDITRFDYTVALDKDNNLYIKSKNPYIKYNEFTGFTLPKEKDKFNLSLYGELEYDFNSQKLLPYVGANIDYKYYTGGYKFEPINKNHFINIGIKYSILKF